MAEIPVLQHNLNLTVLEHSAQQVKFIPKNPDGTVYDLTGWNAVTVNVLASSFSRVEATTFSPTIILADATGMTVEIGTGQSDSVIDYLGTSRGAYLVGLGDGTDTMKAAYGNLQGTITGSALV